MRIGSVILSSNTKLTIKNTKHIFENLKAFRDKEVILNSKGKPLF